MKFHHAAIWLDHQRAHIVSFDDEDSESERIHAHGAEKHLHHKRGALGSGHAPENAAYYDSIVAALAGFSEILVIGPSSAKDALVKHIEAHHPALRKAIAGIEAADHPTNGEILAHARHWFKAADRLRPGTGMKLAP